jgi:hypothetical protein
MSCTLLWLRRLGDHITAGTLYSQSLELMSCTPLMVTSTWVPPDSLHALLPKPRAACCSLYVDVAGVLCSHRHRYRAPRHSGSMSAQQSMASEADLGSPLGAFATGGGAGAGAGVSAGVGVGGGTSMETSAEVPPSLPSIITAPTGSEPAFGRWVSVARTVS